MDYKERYEQALEKARMVINSYESRGLKDLLFYAKEDLSYIFPELKESEDERIRQEICKLLWDNAPYEEAQEYIAWLEKQGGITKLSEEEQNRFAKGVLSSCAMSFIDYLDAHKYEGKMCVSNGECEDIENAFHNAMWDKLHRYYCKYIKKQGEQKPTAWNEEDEEMLGDAIGAVGAADYYTYDDKHEIERWLKSLKERIGE